MAGTYATKTEVPVSRSFDEVKRTLQRFGASAFGYVEMDSMIAVRFKIDGLDVMMRMTLPDRKQFEYTANGRWRPDTAIEKDYEQACRQRWRTLSNGIKAKLAMVDDGISTVEREFLADVLTSSGETVGELIAPQLREIVERGDVPSMMPGLPTPGRIIALGERTGS